MKDHPKKSKDGVRANLELGKEDENARDNHKKEEALPLRGGVFTREDLLVDISQRLKVMRMQEANAYVVRDYLNPAYQKKLRELTERDVAKAETDKVEKAAKESTAAAPGSSNTADPLPSEAAAAADDNRTTPTNSTINELWREKICEWCYQVVDHFDYNREVVSVAMNYLDRYLATRTVNRRIFQLAAMTALYLAIKLFEPGKLKMSSLIDLSRGYFVAEHVATMEDSMLQSLKWYVHPPTSFAFCRDFMRLVSGDIAPRARHDVNELARFMTELSVCDYWFIAKKPSSIALAALINAIELQGPRKVDPRYKVEFLHRVVELGMDIASDDEIIECYERLREMFIAGGYTPNLEDPEVVRPRNEASRNGASRNGENNSRIATVSPTGSVDGPDSDDLNDDDLSQMECI